MINRLLFSFYYRLFWFLARWYPPKPVELHPRNFRNILVFSAAGIGDTLTDSVAVRALKESFPQAQLIVVTHRRRASLVQHNPFADKVVLYHKSLLHFLTLVLELRKKRPDVIVMLRGNDPDLWPLAYLVNRHAIVSCPIMTRFKFLISHPVEIPSWDRTHGVEQTLAIVRHLGAAIQDRRLIYRVMQDEKERLQAKLVRWGIHNNPRVVFQVGGGRRSVWRDWPISHFAELGKRLLGEYAVHLILLGGRDLRPKATVLSSALLPARTINVAGKLSLTESAALLSLSQVLVSTDTGIMHLGFAVGIDTLALIHCNNPASRVGPYGYEDQHLIAQLEPPSGISPSKEIDMRLLTPEKVWPQLYTLCERHRFPRKN